MQRGCRSLGELKNTAYSVEIECDRLKTALKSRSWRTDVQKLEAVVVEANRLLKNAVHLDNWRPALQKLQNVAGESVNDLMQQADNEWKNGVVQPAQLKAIN